MSIVSSITLRIGDSMDTAEKVRENRLRRMATRLGYEIRKARPRKLTVDSPAYSRGYLVLRSPPLGDLRAGPIFESLKGVEQFLVECESELAVDRMVEYATREAHDLAYGCASEIAANRARAEALEAVKAGDGTYEDLFRSLYREKFGQMYILNYTSTFEQHYKEAPEALGLAS